MTVSIFLLGVVLASSVHNSLQNIVECGPNAVYNLNTYLCECRPGYEGSNPLKGCKSICGENARWENNGCVCNPGYVGNPRKGCVACRVNEVYDASRDKCVCAQGYSFHRVADRCVRDCGDYAFNDPARDYDCMCKDGYMPDPTPEEGCRKECGPNSHWDPVSRNCECDNGYQAGPRDMCIPVCGRNAFNDRSDNYRCKCNRGYEGDPMRGCTEICVEHAHYDPNSDSCVCDDGYWLFNRMCIPKCGKNADNRRGNNYECECNRGYEGNPMVECTLICPDNAHYVPSSESCECDIGYQRGERDMCVPICGENAYNNRRDNYRCACNRGYEGDPVRGCTKICKPNSHYDNSARDCVCDRGYIGDPERGCIPDCAENMIFDAIRYRCVCIDDYYWLRSAGRCVRVCGDNAFNHQDQDWRCVCRDGFVGDALRGCREECQENAHWEESSQECVCNGGYMNVPPRGVCAPICGPNAYNDRRDNYACKCRRGYVGNPSSPEGCREECNRNSHWDASARVCVCDIGYIGNPDRGCIEDCKINEMFDAERYRCVCEDGYYYHRRADRCVRRCGDYAINEPSRNYDCVCKDGYVGNPTPEAGCRAECGENEHYESGSGRCVCNGGYMNVPPRGICAPICGPNAYNDRRNNYECACRNGFVPDPTPEKGCREACRRYSHWDSGSRGCVCDVGYIGDPDRGCVEECGENMAFDHDRYRCVCIEGYLWSYQARRCVMECGENAFNDRNRNWDCVCRNGYEGDPINGCRLSCGDNEHYDVASEKCECNGGFMRVPPRGVCAPICGVNAYNDRNNDYRCACKRGYEPDPEPEVGCRESCSRYSHWDSASRVCVCDDGYVGSPDRGCVEECGDNMRFDRDQYKCVCIDNYYWLNRARRCVRQCGDNANNNPARDWMCECREGYVGDPLSSCREECKENEHYDESQGKCVCNLGFMNVPPRGVCAPICGPNAYNDRSDNYRCKCKRRYEPDPTPEVGCREECNPYSHWDSSSRQCVCDVGYIGDPQRGCVPECDKNEVFDPSSYKCVCIKGYYMLRMARMCVPQCGENAYNARHLDWDCECKDGYQGDPLDECRIVCPQFSYYDGRQCVCDRGYVGEPDRGCVPECTGNMIWSPRDYKCVCARGYFYHAPMKTCLPECGKNAHNDYSAGGVCVCDVGCQGDPIKGCEPICKGVNTYWRVDTQRCCCKDGYYGDPNKGCPTKV